ncbi:MAG: FmdE family protein [Methanoregulaceae archaeon]|jgi:formylmethanofuran dehydrogenase subunit E|nr:FmdE family protein [Methanoregulaceae archaeon]
MEQKIAPFEEVVAFHGHTCPGLAIGYRVARAALQALSVERPDDEELVAIVENDACGIDAIQYVAGTTVGKGNLIFCDYGKRAWTFINRRTGHAVRVAEKPEFFEKKSDPLLSDLVRKVRSGEATEEEQREFFCLSEQYVRDLLAFPAEEMFTIRRVTPKIPEQARIFRSFTCAVCGESVAESRARVRDGKIVCIPCHGHYTRGWG